MRICFPQQHVQPCRVPTAFFAARASPPKDHRELLCNLHIGSGALLAPATTASSAAAAHLRQQEQCVTQGALVPLDFSQTNQDSATSGSWIPAFSGKADYKEDDPRKESLQGAWNTRWTNSRRTTPASPRSCCLLVWCSEHREHGTKLPEAVVGWARDIYLTGNLRGAPQTGCSSHGGC